MEQVGYDTYCKLLDEVVKEMQGVKVEEEKDVQIDMNISSFIPDEYIENGSQKIEVYQDIALCKTDENLNDVIDGIIDRYGNMPEEVENLIEVAKIKMLCKNANIIKLVQRDEKAVFYFDNEKFDMQIVNELIKKYRNQIRFSPGKDPYVTYNLDINIDKEIIIKLKDFLKSCNLRK